MDIWFIKTRGNPSKSAIDVSHCCRIKKPKLKHRTQNSRIDVFMLHHVSIACLLILGQ